VRLPRSCQALFVCNRSKLGRNVEYARGDPQTAGWAMGHDESYNSNTAILPGSGRVRRCDDQGKVAGLKTRGWPSIVGFSKNSHYANRGRMNSHHRRSARRATHGPNTRGSWPSH